MPAQRTITFNDGKKIPAVGWGSGSGGFIGSGQRAVDAGVIALKEGILHIDTAQIYKTEEETAESIKLSGIPREKIFVTTKRELSEALGRLLPSGADEVTGRGSARVLPSPCPLPPPRPLADARAVWKIDATTPELIRESVEGSIKRLGTIPDLLLIHNPYIPEEGKIGAFWTILEDLVYDGTLKGCSLGFSNFRTQDVAEVLKVARIKPVANQVEFHPFLWAQLEPLQKFQAEHGIVFQSYGPLTPLLRHPTGGSLKAVVEKIAKERNIEPSTVLLLWTVQKNVVAITTSNNPERIKKLAEIDSLPDLSAAEIAAIDEAGKKVHFRHYTEHMEADFPAPNLPSDA